MATRRGPRPTHAAVHALGTSQWATMQSQRRARRATVAARPSEKRAAPSHAALAFENGSASASGPPPA
jgi:hypothetical protein